MWRTTKESLRPFSETLRLSLPISRMFNGSEVGVCAEEVAAGGLQPAGSASSTRGMFDTAFFVEYATYPAAAAAPATRTARMMTSTRTQRLRTHVRGFAVGDVGVSSVIGCPPVNCTISNRQYPTRLLDPGILPPSCGFPPRSLAGEAHADLAPDLVHGLHDRDRLVERHVRGLGGAVGHELRHVARLVDECVVVRGADRRRLHGRTVDAYEAHRPWRVERRGPAELDASLGAGDRRIHRRLSGQSGGHRRYGGGMGGEPRPDGRDRAVDARRREVSHGEDPARRTEHE